MISLVSLMENQYAFLQQTVSSGLKGIKLPPLPFQVCIQIQDSI